MKKLYLLILLALLPLLASAELPDHYDAIIDDIFYSLDSNKKTATVTCDCNFYRYEDADANYDDFYDVSYNSHPYSDAIMIPSSVTYNGVEYSVTGIGPYAFASCTGLTSITIPSSVKAIGRSAFSGCSGLTEVNYNATNCYLNIFAIDYYDRMMIPYPIFEGCTSLTTLNIGNNVQSIPDDAFSGCSGLTKVTIPSSVTYIGWRAFKGCSGLTNISIPNSVKAIGNGAFSGCSGLTNITIPSSVTSIGGGAFQGCSGLTEVNFNATNCTHSPIIESDYDVDSGYDWIFENCTSLTTLNIGSNVQSIPDYAFYGCSSLTSITIPSSVKAIGKRPFDNCIGLTEVNFNATNCTFSEEIINEDDSSYYSSIFNGCTSLTTLNIGSNVQSIPNYAFIGCSGLTSITIPNSVTNIGDDTFSGCSGLTEVNYNAINCTGTFVFDGCTSLTKLNIGINVQSIPNYAFIGCSSLVDVFCYAENVPSASSNTFPSNHLTLYVPNASIDKYKTTSPWSGFKEIKALTDDTPEDPEIPGAERCATPTIVFADGELTFTCETEGVEFVPKVTCTPTYTLEGNKMRMGATFNISVYARREGYNKSEAATKTIEAKELGDVNGDGKLTIVDLTLLVKKIMGTP